MRNSPSSDPLYCFADSQGFAIAAGAYHTCAVQINGSVWCWGSNGNGQLGIGNTTDQHSPVAVEALTGYQTLKSATCEYDWFSSFDVFVLHHSKSICVKSCPPSVILR